VSDILSTRCHRLAESLAELKVRVRAALATELARAVGAAVRDVLVVSLVDRMIAPTRSAPARPPAARPPVGWRADEEDRERDEWGYAKDAWDESDEDRHRTPARYSLDEVEETEHVPPVPVAAAVAVGVQAARWWLAKKGTVGAAVGLGVLATGLGLAGGPVARAALAVLAAATDLLAAESALARADPS
jgi:hypothetical protein